MRNETSLYEGFKIVEYEKEILSICLAGANRAADMEIIFENLKPEYFNERSHADVFRAVCDMVNGVHGTRVPFPDVATLKDYIYTNTRYFKMFREMELISWKDAVDGVLNRIANADQTTDARTLVIRIIENYKTRERRQIGAVLQTIAGGNLDTPERRQQIYDRLAELENLGNNINTKTA